MKKTNKRYRQLLEKRERERLKNKAKMQSTRSRRLSELHGLGKAGPSKAEPGAGTLNSRYVKGEGWSFDSSE